MCPPQRRIILAAHFRVSTLRFEIFQNAFDQSSQARIIPMTGAQSIKADRAAGQDIRARIEWVRDVSDCI